MESSSGSVRQHLNRFAFATILAGVGLLALAWPASAEIVYTAVDIHVKPTSSYSLDLNNDGVTDLTIKADYFKSVVNGRVTCQGSFVSETPANGSAAETGTGYGPLVLSRGDPIGPSQGYYSGQGDLAYWKRGWFCRNGVFGYWWNISGGYLGLMFQINGETHYGWAKLSVHGNVGNALSATLTGYAYETVAGMAINAGQTKEALDDPTEDQQAYLKGRAHYSVTDLGALGGTYGTAEGISNNGLVAGDADLTGNGTQHAFLWRNGVITDLGTLGGPNSAGGSINESGQIAGIAQTSTIDPLGEDWAIQMSCSPSGDTCQGYQYLQLAFLWQDGTMAALPTLGGNNASLYNNNLNNHGQVAGWAENSTQDPNCIPPQVLDWEAVIWGPKQGEIHELPPLPGDSIGAALAINDNGQVVGTSGACGVPSFTLPLQAVLWQNGKVIKLGSLGGALGNVALGINNRGQVVGVSDLPGDTTSHAFFWTKERGMQDLGTLPGDYSSAAYAINNEGQVVVQSCDVDFNCRVALWQNGVMTDLNALTPPGSLYLVVPAGINDLGEITGQAFDPSTGDAPAFLATPECEGDNTGANSPAAQANGNSTTKVVLPEDIREQLRQRRGFGRLGAGPMRTY